MSDAEHRHEFRWYGQCSDADQPEEVRMLLTVILIVLLVLALGGAGWGHKRYGYAGWSPAGVLLAILLIMWFTGHLHG